MKKFVQISTALAVALIANAASANVSSGKLVAQESVGKLKANNHFILAADQAPIFKTNCNCEACQMVRETSIW